jgi:hypothetical protein
MIRRLALATLATLSMMGGVTFAQETSLRFYIVPLETVVLVLPAPGGGTFEMVVTRPKYIGELGASYSSMGYGLDATALVGANLTDAQHAFVSGQGDVVVIQPLDNAIGGNPVLNQTRNKLEQTGIPADQIVASTTNRQMVGLVGRLCLIRQRLQGRQNKRLFESGVTLNSNLTPDLLDQLVDVGGSFGLDTSSLNLGVTVRQALLILAGQLPAFSLAGEVF